MLYGWGTGRRTSIEDKETDKTMEKQNIEQSRLYIGLFAMVVGMVLLNALSFFRQGGRRDGPERGNVHFEGSLFLRAGST